MNDYKIIDTEFSEHMADSYVQYAKEVLEGRAIPSANDGLKPVQRRILQSLYSLGLHPNSQYKKCARAVGDCLGKQTYYLERKYARYMFIAVQGQVPVEDLEQLGWN